MKYFTLNVNNANSMENQWKINGKSMEIQWKIDAKSMETMLSKQTINYT